MSARPGAAWARAEALAGALAGALALAATGCAGVEVESDPRGGRSEGLLVYPPRAVLLPAAIGPDGAVVSTRLAWIPDLGRPVRVSTAGGLGRTGLALTLHDGGAYEGYVVRLEAKAVDGRVPELLRAAGDAAGAALTGVAIVDAARR